MKISNYKNKNNNNNNFKIGHFSVIKNSEFMEHTNSELEIDFLWIHLDSFSSRSRRFARAF